MIVLNKHSIDASITERYANISYIFEFENANDYGSNELAFEITIHPDAFISGFIADIDGELFLGETKEKKEAKKEYTSAKQKNENAILISQPYPDIPNVFKIQTNIDSKSKILLTIKIEQYLKKQFNFNELNIEIINATDFKSNIKPNYENILFEIKIRDKRGIFDIKLPSNNDIVIDTNIINKNKTLCTINGKIISRINEFILKYKINGEQNESNTLYDPKSKTFVHIINNITSNAIINNNNNILEGKNDDNKIDNIIPRRVVFIVDKSASMQGSKWNKTILATIKTLKQLRNNYDRYCVVFFDENIELSSNIGMILADKTNIFQTISYVRNQRIGGATNIEIALLKGIELIKNDIKLFTDSDFKENNFFENQIIFMTDGEPNRGEINTNNIISNVINKNKLNDKYSEKISIFSFGVGSDKNDSSWTKDLNHSFLKLLSLNNNGIYKRIKQSQCDTQLNEYFNILSKPILCNINIKYQDSNCNNLTKTFFNTLYSGNDIIICGQLENDKILNLTANISAITGIKQNNNSKFCVKPVEINKEIKINLMDSISTISIDEKENINDINNNNIERIYAFLKLKQFAEKRLLNNDMIEYDDNDNKLPLLLAMKYSFVTPWTSMIVVKHKSVKTEHQLDNAKNNGNFQVPNRYRGYHLNFICDDFDDYDDNEYDMNKNISPDDYGLKIDYQLETVAKSKIVRRLSFPLGKIDYTNNTIPISPIDDDDSLQLSDVSSDENDNNNIIDELKQNSLFTIPSTGKTTRERWLARSISASDLIACGSFDLAQQKLHREFGIVNFEPLKKYFLNIYTSCNGIFSIIPNNTYISVGIRRDEKEKKEYMANISLTLHKCHQILKNAYLYVTNAEFENAISKFREILHIIPLLIISSTNELKDVRNLIQISSQYINALRVKLEANESKNNDEQRQFELNCYFTHFELQDPHQFSALYGAIKLGYKGQYYKTTGILCTRLLELAVSGDVRKDTSAKYISQIKKVLSKCESKMKKDDYINNNKDNNLKYKPHNFTYLCNISFEPINRNEEIVKSSYCKSIFKSKYNGQLSPVCNLVRIGANNQGVSINNK